MEKSIRKITQYYPARYLGKQTMELIDEKLVLDWKDIFSSYQTTVDLKDLNPKYNTGRYAFDAWSNLSAFFFVVAIIMDWLPIIRKYMLIPAVIAVVFLMLQLRKYDWIYFWDNLHINSLSIRYSGSSLAKKEKKNFVENLVREIEKVHE